jgi:hypothetical protein
MFDSNEAPEIIFLPAVYCNLDLFLIKMIFEIVFELYYIYFVSLAINNTAPGR